MVLSLTRRVSNTDIDIIGYPLHLDEPPAALLAQIVDLAQSAWQRGVDASTSDLSTE